ncbi:MAG: hypothetical protein U1E26_11340 [Coriobacteriia bacterium]|nr:hypothetical protein [Coriobacteriia bacterium]
MIYELLIFAMLIVIVGFTALAVSGTPANLEAHPRLRWAAIAFWWFVLIGGWACFAYLATLPGGLDAAWAWTRAQPYLMQAAMWLLLLPWMVGLAIWQLGWPPIVRTGLIVAMAVGWSSLAFTLARPKRTAERVGAPIRSTDQAV